MPQASAAPALVFALALAARLLFLALEPPTRLVGDEKAWLVAGEELASPGVRFDPLRSTLAFYPPLHPYLIAVASELGGRTAVKLAQCLLGALLVFPVVGVGRLAFDGRVAVAAGLAVALYPELVYQSVHLWSEPLFMVLLWCSLALLLRADGERDGVPHPGAAAGAGALLGLAALTRDPALYFAPLAASWLVLRQGRPRRRSLAAAGAFVAALLLVVAPWTLRNQLRLGTPVPVSLMGARTFWEANAGGHQQVIEEYAAIEAAEGPLAAYRHAWREGLAAVKQRQPWWLAEQLVRQLPPLWTTANAVVIHLERQAYGAVAPWVAWSVLAVTALPHVLFTAGFLVGVAVLPVSRSRALLLLFLAYYVAIHLVTLGHPRLRLPLVPLVVLFALETWRLARERRIAWTPARRLLAAALLLAFALCLLDDLAGFRGEPVFGLA